MSNTIQTYVGNGSQTDFAFSFDYLRKEFVKVLVDGAEVAYTFHTTQTVKIIPAPATGKVIIIRRATDTTRLVTFVDGSVLLAGDLNVAQLQAIHIAAEALDAASGSLLIDETGAYSAGFRRLANLGDPVETRDAVTKEWAETSGTAVLGQTITARNAAQAAEADAEAAATAAAGSATTATTKASEASASAANAATSATAASTARTGAETARTGAETAQTGAQTARTGAETARTQAQSAQTAAEAARDQAQTFVPTIATQAEAQAGTNNTKLMSPLRVREGVLSVDPLELIGVYDLAGLSQLVVNNLSAYRDLDVDIVARPATNNVAMGLRFSFDNGVTFNSTASYSVASMWASSTISGNTANMTLVQLNRSGGMSNNVGYDLHSTLKIRDFNKNKQRLYRYHTGFNEGTTTAFVTEMGAGVFYGAGVLNAFQFLPGSGNFAYGQLVIKGRKG